MFKMILGMWPHLPFACAMAGRELKSLNKGAILGIGWLILRPLIQVVSYVVIVTVVFGARLGSSASPLDYGLYVLSGLFGWQLLQRSLEDSTSLIRDRMEVLKQIVYPVETLPITAFLSNSIGAFVVLAVYLLLAAISGKLILNVLLLPVALIILLTLMLGLSWLFMIAGVILKDMREIVSVIMSLMIYFTPVLLNETMLPAGLWRYVLMNPLSHVILMFRDVFQGGFHPLSWAGAMIMAIAAFSFGAWAINRAKVMINEYI